MQMLSVTNILQQRFLQSERELAVARSKSEHVAEYFDNLIGQRSIVATTLAVSEWQDARRTICTVTNLNKLRGADGSARAQATAIVNLGALAEKKYGMACSKKCMLFDVGPCVHVIAGLKKKGFPVVEHGMRQCEMLNGLEQQLAGGFPLPDASATAKQVLLLYTCHEQRLHLWIRKYGSPTCATRYLT